MQLNQRLVPFNLPLETITSSLVLRRDTAEAAQMASGVRINEDEVVELAEMFRLMSDPTRLKIILACLDQPVSVGATAEMLSISPSLVSHHLRLLRAARLLQADRRGRQVFYMVGDPHIRSMLTDMVDHVAEGVESEIIEGG